MLIVTPPAGQVGQCKAAYDAYVATNSGATAVNAQYTATKAQCNAAGLAIGPVQSVRNVPAHLGLCTSFAHELPFCINHPARSPNPPCQ